MENRASTQRLYRSRQQRMIAGVAGGLAQYFKVDPVLVRLGLVAMFLIPPVGGAVFLAYIAMAIIVPLRPIDESEPPIEGTPVDTTRAREVGGLILVAFGLVILAGNLGFHYLFTWFNWQLVWPAILIAIGAALLLRRQA